MGRLCGSQTKPNTADLMKQMRKLQRQVVQQNHGKHNFKNLSSPGSCCAYTGKHSLEPALNPPMDFAFEPTFALVLPIGVADVDKQGC